MWWRRVRYVVFLVALCAIATCPSAKRSCTAKSRAREAEDLVGYLADRVVAAIAANGRVPATAAGPTPSPACCEQGGTCSPDPAIWNTPGWQALAFSIDDDHHYSYSYIPDPSGRSAVIRAVGDLDCDGVAATYELEIRVDSQGVHRKWSRQHPYE